MSISLPQYHATLIIIKDNMFKDFAVPTRIVQVTSDEELLKYINIYNGRTNVYSSLYWYSVESTDEFDNEIRRANIDKIFFDVDADVESAKKLASYLIEKDLKFQVFNSGRGWHFYLPCTGEGNASNLRIAQLSILHDAKTLSDPSSIGDTQRISRVPNTWNFSASRYCIPIKVEEIGMEDYPPRCKYSVPNSKENDHEQRFERIVYGNKILRLDEYTETKFEWLKPEIVPNLKMNTNLLLIPCIRNSISKINPSHQERFIITCYLSDTIRRGKLLHSFNINKLCEEILNFYKNNATHWLDFNLKKTNYFIHNIVPKFDFPVTCGYLKRNGMCIGCVLDKLWANRKIN